MSQENVEIVRRFLIVVDVDEAGGIHPLEGLVMAQQGDSSLTVAMYFANEDQASQDLQPRTDLASGPAPGQGGP